MKITISVECSTEEEALEVVSNINGVSGDAPAKSPAKKSTPKKAAAEATKEAASPPKKPAAAKKKAAPKKKASDAPSLDEVKDQILEAAGGDMSDPEIATQVKDYIATFDVAKLSDMDEDTRRAAFDGAEDYFGGEEEVDEDDPMA